MVKKSCSEEVTLKDEMVLASQREMENVFQVGKSTRAGCTKGWPAFSSKINVLGVLDHIVFIVTTLPL